MKWQCNESDPSTGGVQSACYVLTPSQYNTTLAIPRQAPSAGGQTALTNMLRQL